jgi:hypothetical protein
MRRLWMAAAMDSVVHAEFGPSHRAQTPHHHPVAGDPTFRMARAATMIGLMLPPEVFSERPSRR